MLTEFFVQIISLILFYRIPYSLILTASFKHQEKRNTEVSAQYYRHCVTVTCFRRFCPTANFGLEIVTTSKTSLLEQLFTLISGGLKI
jgi:hypothetical protein